MKNRSSGVLAATAAFAFLGGLHLEIASGRVLDRPALNDTSVQTGASVAATGINRAAKTDRSRMETSLAEDRTVTFQHPNLPSTTVALRLRETAGAARLNPASTGKSPVQKPKHVVACEGVVSVLTEVAKYLQAGRCVT